MADFSVKTVFDAIDRTTAPIRTMTRAARTFTRVAETGLRRVGRRFESLTRRAQAFGKKAAAVAAIGSAGFIAMAANGAQFEQTMVNASVKFPQAVQRGTAEFTKLSDAAKAIGRTTEFSASQAASAVNYLAMAGFNANQTMAALPGVVDLATASQVDLASATDIASDTLGAFGLMTKDTTKLQTNLARVNDVLAKTTSTANTNMFDMFEAIKDGGPVARAAGADIETFSTLVAAIANAGIKGTRAGTALKNVLLSVGAPGSQAAKVMRALGIQTEDANGNVRDILKVLEDFKKATAGMGTAQQTKIYNAIFGKIPISAAINLIDQAGDSMEAYRKQLRNSQGTASRMASEMRNTTLGSWKSLQSAVESVSIKIFELQSGPLKAAIDRTTAWVRANGDLIASGIGDFLNYMIDHFKDIVKWGMRIGGVIAIFVTLNTVLQTLIGIITLVNIAMAANPIVLIVAAIVAGIAALSYGIYMLIKHFDEVKAWFDGLPGWVKESLNATLIAIMPLVGIPVLIARKWGLIKAVFKEVADYITGNITAAINKLKAAIDAIVSAYKKTKAFVSGVSDSVGKAVGNAADAVGSGVSSAASWVGGALGFGGDDSQDQQQSAAPNRPQVISPQERAAIITSHTETQRGEVVIRDETGKAEQTKAAPGVTLQLSPSGGF